MLVYSLSKYYALMYSLQERESQLNVLHEELKQLQIKKEAAVSTACV